MENPEVSSATQEEIGNLAAISFYRDQIGATALQIWAGNPTGTQVLDILNACLKQLNDTMQLENASCGDDSSCIGNWTCCNTRCIPPGMPCIE